MLNVSFKIFTKVLANRLTEVANKVERSELRSIAKFQGHSATHSG